MLFLPAIPGVVLGFVARSRIRRSHGTEKGQGLALAGIIIGFFMIAVGLLSFDVIFTGTDTHAPPFTETFSSNDHRFPSWHISEISADAQDGKYQVRANDKHINYSWALWTHPISSVGIRATMTLSANSATGLAVSGDNTDDYLYLFEVSANKAWTLDRIRYEKEQFDQLASGQSQAIAPNQPLKLALDAQHRGNKTTIAVWLGGHELKLVSDPAGFGDFNHVGLTFRSESPPSTFSVDNVVVTNRIPQH